MATKTLENPSYWNNYFKIAVVKVIIYFEVTSLNQSLALSTRQ